MDEHNRTLLTRGEIIKIWKECSKEKMKKVCCPDCRDILLTDIVDGVRGIACCNYNCHNKQLFSEQKIADGQSVGYEYRVIGVSNK